VRIEGTEDYRHQLIASEVLQIYGIVVIDYVLPETEGEECGPGCIIIMNNSPRINEALKDTKWGNGGWMSVIKQLPGVKPWGKSEGRKTGKTRDFGLDPDNKSAGRRKSRGIEIPLTYAPSKIYTADDPRPFGDPSDFDEAA